MSAVIRGIILAGGIITGLLFVLASIVLGDPRLLLEGALLMGLSGMNLQAIHLETEVKKIREELQVLTHKTTEEM